MPRIVPVFIALFALLSPALVAAQSPPAEKRIALVIGNGAYQAAALATTANDAGLVAQTLQAAGFDVVGARDLDQDSLRRAMRDFLEKAQGSGPDTVAFIYLAGYGLQLEGDNFFVPIDGRIARDTDVAVEALRVSDYTRPLAALGLKQLIVVLDAARANPFARSGQPIAGGLALVEPEQGMLIAFNAAPGTIAPEGQGPYGPYAQALAEMMRDGGLRLAEVFDRVRLRVNESTRGAEVPWHAARGEASFAFFERAADAPPPQASPEQTAAIRSRPIRELDAQEAYIAALERDTMEGYVDFLAAYPNDPMAKRVHAIVAARREAITWRRTRVIDTPQAYWSYLRRYPRGPHSYDARRRLAYLSAEPEPPPSFAVMAYDVPPPPPEEALYIDRPVLAFDDPGYGFAPPPPPPAYYLPPPEPDFIALPPPPPPFALFALPVPIYRPVRPWVRPPAYVVAPPANNVIYRNVHNTVVINNNNTVTVTNRTGQTQTLRPPAPPPAAGPGARPPGPGAAPPAALVGPALPPSVAQKAVAIQNSPQGPGAQGLVTPPGGAPMGSRPGGPSGRQPLPGMGGQPLPSAPGVAPGGRPPATATAPSTLPPGTARPGGPGSPGFQRVPPGAPPSATAPTGVPPSASPPGRPGALPPPGSPAPATATAPTTAPALAPRPGGPPPRTGPPPNIGRPPPPSPPPAARLAPPQHSPPPSVSRPPPPAAVARPSPPPPPPRVAAPPPPARAAPPPVQRAAPPPQIARPAAPPPRPAAPPPRPAAKSCKVENGKQVCR